MMENYQTICSDEMRLVLKEITILHAYIYIYIAPLCVAAYAVDIPVYNNSIHCIHR